MNSKKMKGVGLVGMVLATTMLVGGGCTNVAAPDVSKSDDKQKAPVTEEKVKEIKNEEKNDEKNSDTVVTPGDKEFSMTSFYEMVDGKPRPQFSVKELVVRKGDKVKIKITNTKGSHDINIDEFNVKAETPLDKEVVVEFVADKAGEFIYYCSKPGHRANGHWGTLKVIE
jgi:nitrous oxide reductase